MVGSKYLPNISILLTVPNKMKYGPKRLRNKLLEISNLPMRKQKQEITDELHKWMKEEKQIDDILIIGLKFK